MTGPQLLPCETPDARQPKGTNGKTQWVLPATILGSSLSFIDGSVVNVALPAIQGSFGSSLATMQWVVNGYMLMLASLILLGGSVGDRFGRRRIFIAGLIGFAVASMGCGLAPSAGWLIAMRLLQGASAAMLVPASLAIISAAFRGEARGRAIGTWAGAGALTMALGPPFGGWLVDTVGWRSIFYINPPIAAVALFLAWKLPADDRSKGASEPLDLRGSALAVLALGLLSYGLIASGEGSGLIGGLAIAAAVPAGVLFIIAESRSVAPVMALSLFRDRDFAGANGITVLLYAALSGALFLLPFLLIEVHKYSATAAGAALLPFSLIMGLGSRWIGGLVERIGSRILLIIGPLATAVGFVILAVSGEYPGYWIGFLPGLIVVGIGMTVSIPPLTTTVFDSAPDEKSGTASGVNNAAARGGGLVAVAALGLAVGGSELSSMDVNALTNAYRLIMFGAAGLAVLSALVAALTISKRSVAPAREPVPKRP
ncbi:MFS transporter [Phyllobacterium zundukense]|jgi:EmrB/QacA subfamily drug resistance transporter|uniref:MFS transporter n=1 Tax=Phyllobacterium zundukense TaxID=1867719 RepID=A0ACD4D495_9HYPH|nr:MFS transporter [Phyllobacterium zundukense]UXN60599.1 MFS transporter [Phyllobacterium zundukense]